jgi:hypothetical protein
MFVVANTDMPECINDALVEQDMVGDDKILDQPRSRLRAWICRVRRIDGDGSRVIVMRAHR